MSQTGLTLSKVALSLTGLLAGGWMLFDGIHVMLRGKYFGPETPGPWSVLFTRIGINPFRLGPIFILFGTLWLVFLAATLRGFTWGRYAAIAVAVATLWYLPLGTILAIIYLALLVYSGI